MASGTSSVKPPAGITNGLNERRPRIQGQVVKPHRWLRTVLQLPRHHRRPGHRLVRLRPPLTVVGMTSSVIRGLQAASLKRKATSLAPDESGNIGRIHAEKTHLDTIFFHYAVRSTAKNKQGNQAQAGDPE